MPRRLHHILSTLRSSKASGLASTVGGNDVGSPDAALSVLYVHHATTGGSPEGGQ